MIERQIESPIPTPLDFVVKKWLENAFKIFWSYPRPCVTNRDQHITSLVCLGADM